MISKSLRLVFCVAMMMVSSLCASAQQYAGFMEELRNATSDSLMNIDGIEYYLLYEDYENVHFLSLWSERRETFVIGPAVPSDTIYQNGEICGRLGCESLRKPLAEMKPDSMFVDNKYPALFERCESESPCSFKALDTNNFGYKIVMDYPKQKGEKWDYLRYWMINYVDTFTCLDNLYYDDVFMKVNVGEDQLPTTVLKKKEPEAFEIDDIYDGQGVADHYRDIYMRQVYYLKNIDFSFPLCYLRIFMSPRFVSSRYVTLFVSTNLYSYGAHDLPLERYITFDMKNLAVVRNNNLFLTETEEEVRKVVDEEMKAQGHELGNYELPQAAIFENDVVFSFQPYQIGTFADGIFHIRIPKDKLRKYIQKEMLF